MSETQPDQVERTPTGEIKEPPKTTEPTKSETKPEQKPEVKAEGDDKSLLNQKDKVETPKGAPDKYSDFTAPKHWAEKGLELDKEAMIEALPIFKELGLSQEGAQKLVDFYASISEKTSDSALNSVREMRDEWRSKVKADSEIGSKLPQVKATISKAIDGLGDTALARDFREAMDLTGAGDHPAFIKAFYKLAQKVTEGSHVAGGGPSKFGQAKPGAQPESAAKALYPNLS